MSEIRLNLIDESQILCGTIHASVADAAVAALSADPATVAELDAALDRFIKPHTHGSRFQFFRPKSHIDETPWDAGIMIIDLAARIVAVQSTYSHPGPQGEVHYHDGTQRTEVPVRYLLADEWVFVYSVVEYQALFERHRSQRLANPPLDARAVLYGRPLLEWIVRTVNSPEGTALWHRLARERARLNRFEVTADSSALLPENGPSQDDDANPISVIHARWLMTPRDDLRGQSPREVLHARKDFIDFDLESRALQWSLRDEGPPCLSVDSLAYRYAGFGTHEWVIYYDLVRHLIWSGLLCQRLSPNDIQKLKGDDGLTDPTDAWPVEAIELPSGKEQPSDVRGADEIEIAIAQLEEIKTAWLERPQADYDSRTPAILIANERKRLPIALRPRDMIVDENCPTCQLLADETALGLGVGFWHLDGSNMDDDFAFSHFRTREEWEAERREWAEFSKKFNREWEEKQLRAARAEGVESEQGFIGGDPF